MKYNQDNQLVGEDGNLAKYKDINTKQTIHEKLPFTKPNEKWRYNRVDWDALKKKYPGVPIYASCIEENNDPSKYCSYDVEIPKKKIPLKSMANNTIYYLKPIKTLSLMNKDCRLIASIFLVVMA